MSERLLLLLPTYLLLMEFRFDPMCSNLGNKNFDADYVSCSREPRTVAREP